ncbi:cytochrome P450 [Coniella lustricola]|uniref:Cytochrome P450 n=1 Tax=Coniella lustricola TaxID=2025994 RepID=A0A2T3AL80_9PEZI|nr:cytochrome P450 [Coniella lustricola]
MAIWALDLSPGSLFVIVLVATTGFLLSQAIYNVFFHPLRSFPGPLSMRASRVPYCIHIISGRLPFTILELHKRYGSVVRIAPNELVFADARAWKDIMGHRAAGEPEMQKAQVVYRFTAGAPVSILNAPREEHGRMRKQLAHGFSEKSMRSQEPIIMRYVNLLMDRLRENSQGGKSPQDMVKWYNYTTFDIIGDLTFGESFGCLETSHYHPWVTMIFAGIKLGTYSQVARHFPMFQSLIQLGLPSSLQQKRLEHFRLTDEKLLKRIDMGMHRQDLIEGFLRAKDDITVPMSLAQLRMMSSLLIAAGSETTATLLSGVTYLLGKNPEALAKITQEVRTAFSSEEEINFQSVNALQYMLACLDEALRVYPPVPIGMPREVPKGGWTIAGQFVAEDTIVSLYHYALYHNERYFKDAEGFHPERWLGDPRFASDDRELFQPFQLGPRNCIGRNLAYVEMRTILARILWNYNISLADDSQNWMSQQKIYGLWEKDALNVYLTPRGAS